MGFGVPFRLIWIHLESNDMYEISLYFIRLNCVVFHNIIYIKSKIIVFIKIGLCELF